MDINTLQSLTTQPGLTALAQRLGRVDSYYHEPESLGAISPTVRRYLTEDPSMGRVHLIARPGVPGMYFPTSDTVRLGVINPAVVGHEMAHAQNLRNAPLYSKILRVANTVANINNKAAVPAMLALRMFVGNENTRNEILNILSGVSAAVAAPGLMEELGASMAAIKNVPDKLQAVRTLAPAFLMHAAKSMMPASVYQLGKFI